MKKEIFMGALGVSLSRLAQGDELIFSDFRREIVREVHPESGDLYVERVINRGRDSEKVSGVVYEGLQSRKVSLRSVSRVYSPESGDLALEGVSVND